jgi:hypothetical protein
VLGVRIVLFRTIKNNLVQKSSSNAGSPSSRYFTICYASLVGCIFTLLGSGSSRNSRATTSVRACFAELSNMNGGSPPSLGRSNMHLIAYSETSIFPSTDFKCHVFWIKAVHRPRKEISVFQRTSNNVEDSLETHVLDLVSHLLYHDLLHE